MCFLLVSGWFEATQAFETLGFIAAIVALVLVILYIFVPQTSGKRIVFILGMVACFAAGNLVLANIEGFDVVFRFSVRKRIADHH